MDLQKRDEPFEKNIAAPHAWNSYLYLALKFSFLFYLLTSLLEEYLFFIHHGQAWTILDFSAIFLYLVIVVILVVRMIRQLPMAAIMLAAPTMPLVMLLIALFSLPVLHLLHDHLSTVWPHPHPYPSPRESVLGEGSTK